MNNNPNDNMLNNEQPSLEQELENFKIRLNNKSDENLNSFNTTSQPLNVDANKQLYSDQQLSEEEIKSNLLESLRNSDSKIRNLAFNLTLNIVQNLSDAKYKETVSIICKELPSFSNEKNLKIQTSLLKIMDTMIKSQELKLEENHKMLIFNLLDKFLSSNNKKIKTETKKLITQFLINYSEKSFSGFFSLFQRINPKMCKAILFLLDENMEIINHPMFQEQEEELSGFITKFYQNRMADIKKGILKLLKNFGNVFGSDFIENISCISEKDKKNVEKEKPKQKQKTDDYLTAKAETITNKFNKAYVSKILSKKKWKEKMKDLESLKGPFEKIIKLNPNDDYLHLIELATALLKDNVLMIRVYSVNIFAMLFRGLRKQMKRSFKSNFKIFLNMLKDKKVIMTKALQNALSSGYHILPLNELYEEIKVYNKERNKDIRIQIIILLEKYSQLSFLAKKSKLFIKTFIELLTIYSKDPDIGVKTKLMNFLKNYIKQAREELDSDQVIFIQDMISKSVKGSQKIISSLGEYQSMTNISNGNQEKNFITSVDEIKEEKKMKSFQKRKIINKNKTPTKKESNYIEEEIQTKTLKNCFETLINNPNCQNLSEIKKFFENETNINCQIVQIETNLLQKLYEILSDLMVSKDQTLEFSSFQILVELHKYVLKTTKKYVISPEIFLNSVWILVSSNNREFRADVLDFIKSQVNNNKLSFINYSSIISLLQNLLQSKNMQIIEEIFQTLNQTKWLHSEHFESFKCLLLFSNRSSIDIVILIKDLFKDIKLFDNQFSFEQFILKFDTNQQILINAIIEKHFKEFTKNHKKLIKSVLMNKNINKVNQIKCENKFQKQNELKSSNYENLKYKHLECILQEKEPSNIEIGFLHSLIFNELKSLGNDVCSNFFGFEELQVENATKKICTFIKNHNSNSSKKQFIMGLFSCIYVRLFDTQRFGIIYSMCLLFNSLKNYIMKHNIKFETENESLLVMNIIYLILDKSKEYFAALKEKSHSLNIYWEHSRGMSHQGKWKTTSNREIHEKELKSMFETTSLFSSIKSLISILNGKERISKFHSKLILNVLSQGFQSKIETLLEFYVMMILSTNFEYQTGKNDLFPIIKFRYLYELVCLEQIFAKNSSFLLSFTFLWKQIHEKLIYLIEMLSYNNSEQTNFQHKNLLNFLNSFKQNPELFSGNDSIERENLRLAVIEKFVLYWTNCSSEKSLIFILGKNLIKNCINQYFVLDFEKIFEIEQNSETGINDNFEKEIGTSVISKSIIGDDSILGSVNFFENNNSFVNRKESKIQNNELIDLKKNLFFKLNLLTHFSNIPKLLNHLNPIESAETIFKLKIMSERISSRLDKNSKRDLQTFNEEYSLKENSFLIYKKISQSFLDFISYCDEETQIKIISLIILLIPDVDKNIQKFFVSKFIKAIINEHFIWSEQNFEFIIDWFDGLYILFDIFTEFFLKMFDPKMDVFPSLKELFEPDFNAMKTFTFHRSDQSFKENSLLNSFSENSSQNNNIKEILAKFKFLFNKNSFKFFVGFSEDILKSEIISNFNKEEGISFNNLNSFVFDLKRQSCIISKDLDRIHNQDSFKNKRNILKKELQKLISKGLIEFVRKDVIKSKSFLMKNQSKYSNETLNRLLQVTKRAEEIKNKLSKVDSINLSKSNINSNENMNFDIKPSHIQSEKLMDKTSSLKNDQFISKKLNFFNFNQERDKRKESNFKGDNTSFIPDQYERSPMSKSFNKSVNIAPNQVVSDFAKQKNEGFRHQKNPMTPFNSK